MMKAKAEAEAKEMQAKGLKRGEDFVDCEPTPPSLLLCPRKHGLLHVPPSGSVDISGCPTVPPAEGPTGVAIHASTYRRGQRFVTAS